MIMVTLHMVIMTLMMIMVTTCMILVTMLMTSGAMVTMIKGTMTLQWVVTRSMIQIMLLFG